METTQEGTVIGALNDIMRDWESRDLKAIMSNFAPSATVSMFGTGVDEKRVGKDEILAQIKRDFSQSESFNITLDWNLVGISGQVAWVASDVTLRFKAAGQPEMAFPARTSIVLQNYDGRWLVEHAHLSVAAANQQEGQSF